MHWAPGSGAPSLRQRLSTPRPRPLRSGAPPPESRRCSGSPSDRHIPPASLHPPRRKACAAMRGTLSRPSCSLNLLRVVTIDDTTDHINKSDHIQGFDRSMRRNGQDRGGPGVPDRVMAAASGCSHADAQLAELPTDALQVLDAPICPRIPLHLLEKLSPSHGLPTLAG